MIYWLYGRVHAIDSVEQKKIIKKNNQSARINHLKNY